MDVTPATVSAWVKKGLPVYGNGRSANVHLEESRQWVKDNIRVRGPVPQRKNLLGSAVVTPISSDLDATGPAPGVTLNDIRLQKEWAVSMLQRTKVEEMRGTLVNREVVKTGFEQFGRAIAASRKTVAPQLAPKLVGLTDLNEIERIIDEHLRALDLKVSQEIKEIRLFREEEVAA